MAIISDVLDHFRTRLPIVLPNATELANGIVLEANIDATLEYGWAVNILEGIPSPIDELCSQIVTQYAISVVLTQDTTRIQSSNASLIDAIKTLYNNEILVRKDVLIPNLLLGNSNAQIFFEGVTAPAFINQPNTTITPILDTEKFIYITSNYTIRTQD